MRFSRPFQIVAAAVILAGAGAMGAVLAPSAAGASPTAPAIPSGQHKCTTTVTTITGGTSSYRSFGLRLKINNGSSRRAIVAFVSMDANVTPDAELRLTWNAGQGINDYQYGPGNIAENQQFDGTRTVMDVIPLGPGRHTLVPQIRLSGNSTTSGTVLRACAVVEAYTS
ncbi:MAG TPA: hypothetical protein VMA32_04275 [Streptosporangiaceae bacterium]|nr:hypothetical protein [Streptosporangiaceae bacterium]